MAGGKSKKKKKGQDKGGGGGGDKKKATTNKKSGRKTRHRRIKSSKCTVDIFTDIAMENAYTTCHNVQDLLKWRGFPWPDAQKKKKKGKK